MIEVSFSGGFMHGQSRRFRGRVSRFERAVRVKWLGPEVMVNVVEVYESIDGGNVLSMSGTYEAEVRYHLTWKEAAEITGAKFGNHEDYARES